MNMMIKIRMIKRKILMIIVVLTTMIIILMTMKIINQIMKSNELDQALFLVKTILQSTNLKKIQCRHQKLKRFLLEKTLNKIRMKMRMSMNMKKNNMKRKTQIKTKIRKEMKKRQTNKIKAKIILKIHKNIKVSNFKWQMLFKQKILVTKQMNLVQLKTKEMIMMMMTISRILITVITSNRTRIAFCKTKQILQTLIIKALKELDLKIKNLIIGR